MTRMSWNNPPDLTPEGIKAAFDEQYYRSGNYADYAERRDRYLRTAAEILDELERLSLANVHRTVLLDYGAGPGYLLDGFEERGYAAFGVDVSEWAREQAKDRGFDVRAQPDTADVMTALDVFEHMTDEQVAAAIRAVNPRVIVARIPVSTDGVQFHLAVSRRDPTHTNMKRKEEWEAFFAGLGYLTMRLSLFTVYDSPGVACLLGVRK